MPPVNPPYVPASRKTAITDAERVQWSQFLRDFDGALKTVRDNVTAMERMRPIVEQRHPTLRAEWTRVYNSGKENLAKLEALKETRDKVKGWLSGAWQAVKEIFGLSGLGVLPVVVIAISSAAALAAIAAGVKWVTEANGLARKLALLEKGVAPGDIAKASGEEDLFSKLGSNLIFTAGLVILAIYLVPKLLPQR